MSELSQLTREQMRGLLDVLHHPQHQQGLQQRTMTLLSVVERASALTRITGALSGADPLAAWELPNPTVRLALPGAPAEFAGVPGAPSTTSRVYTVAEVDPAHRIVRIDIVRHGERSPAMRWLGAAQAGDRVAVLGPRPHRTPGDGLPRVLLADSSALPAAARIVRMMPTVSPTIVVAAVPDDEFALLEADLALLAGPLELTQVTATGATPLAAAFANLELPSTASVWAAGEREDIREIRRRCRQELLLPPERMQVFGYWKRGTTNTMLDVARLQATYQAMASSDSFVDIDDFEIGL